MLCNIVNWENISNCVRRRESSIIQSVFSDHAHGEWIEWKKGPKASSSVAATSLWRMQLRLLSVKVVILNGIYLRIIIVCGFIHFPEKRTSLGSTTACFIPCWGTQGNDLILLVTYWVRFNQLRNIHSQKQKTKVTATRKCFWKQSSFFLALLLRSEHPETVIMTSLRVCAHACPRARERLHRPLLLPGSCRLGEAQPRLTGPFLETTVAREAALLKTAQTKAALHIKQ